MASGLHLPAIGASQSGPSISRTRNSQSRELIGDLFPPLTSDFKTNQQLVRERIEKALAQPNISIKRHENYKPRPHLTAISMLPKFRSIEELSRYECAIKAPYEAARDSQDRFIMSGYKGFIPRSRYMCGHSFPTVSHNAINEFEDQRAIGEYVRLQPILGGPTIDETGSGSICQSLLSSSSDPYIIYRSDMGLIPNYSGFIPGHKNKFGGTFMNVTHDAMGRSSS